MTRDPKDFMAHENVPREEVSEEIYGEPIVTLFPVLLRFFGSPYARHRKHAVIACNHFIAGRPGHPVFENLILPYIQVRGRYRRRSRRGARSDTDLWLWRCPGCPCPAKQSLYNTAMDTDSDVRREVCASLVCLMETHPKHLMPQINQIIAYMLSSTRDSVIEVCPPCPST